MKFTIYVIADNDSDALVNMQRVCARRTALLHGSKESKYTVEPCARALAIIERIANSTQPPGSNSFEFHLCSDTASNSGVLARCRALQLRVLFTSVAAELRRHRLTTSRGSSICERCAPTSVADAVGSSKVWYAKIRAHVLAADPRALLVVAGAPGVGKTCFINAIADELSATTTLLALPNERIDSDKEPALYDAIVDAVRSHARSNVVSAGKQQRLMIVLDNVDYLHQGKLLVAALREVAAKYTTRKVALIALVNNWFGRHAVNALRKLPPPTKSSPFRVVLCKCEPVPSAPDIEKHLARVLPQSTAVMRNAIALECRGDVRAAMLRTAFETQTAPAQRKVVQHHSASGAFIEQTAADRFSATSLAQQTAEVVDEMRVRRARVAQLELVWSPAYRGRVGDFVTPVEQRFQTLDTAQTAEDMLFANYPRLLPLAGYAASTNAAADLDAAACFCETQSLADTMRTTERRQCYKGASENMTLGVGVTVAAAIISRRLPLSRPSYMEMDFKHATVRASSQKTAAMLAHLGATLRVGASLLANADATVFANNSDGTPPRAEYLSSVGIDVIERVALGAGWFVSDAATLHYARRLLESATLSAASRLRPRITPYVLRSMEFAEVRAQIESNRLTGIVEKNCARVREAALAEAKKRCALGDEKLDEAKLAAQLEEAAHQQTLVSAAARAAHLGLEESEFVSAVQYAESLHNMGISAKERVTTNGDLLGKIYRETRHRQRAQLRLHRLDIDVPVAKRARVEKKQSQAKKK
jgi:hypothetical protein